MGFKGIELDLTSIDHILTINDIGMGFGSKLSPQKERINE